MNKHGVRKVDSAQLNSGLVECPGCSGMGYVEYGDDNVCNYVKCDICHGKGKITEHDYEQWERNTVDVYEAHRNYIRMQTAD